MMGTHVSKGTVAVLAIATPGRKVVMYIIRAEDMLHPRIGAIGELKRIRVCVGGPPKSCDLSTEATPAGIDWDAWLGPAPMSGFKKILCPGIKLVQQDIFHGIIKLIIT